MKVFISWSGERSRCVAEALREWLPDVIQAIEPFLSSHDIPKGARWGIELARELEGTSVGIICLTSDNLDARWILFEAGALSKTIDQSRLCTYLLGVGPENLLPPLSDFQATKADKEDTLQMVASINNALGQQRLPGDQLRRTFERWWDILEAKFKAIPASKEPATQPTAEEMIQEIFRFVRSSASRVELSPFPFPATQPFSDHERHLMSALQRVDMEIGSLASEDHKRRHGKSPDSDDVARQLSLELSRLNCQREAIMRELAESRRNRDVARDITGGSRD